MSRLLPALLATAFVMGVLAACSPADRDARLDAVARWEDRRLAPADSLAAFMDSSDPVVRRAALRAAGLIGRSEALPAMIDRLEDSSQAIRAQAAFSLGLLGGEVAVPPLAAALQDPHASVRVAAVAGLAHQDHDGSLLFDVALRGEPREAAAAWTALRNVAARADHDSLVAVIRAGLTRPEREIRWRVLRCAERASDPTLVEQIASFVTDGDVQTRVHALRALARHKGPAALAAVLRSEERHGRLRGNNRRRVEVAELQALGSLLAPVFAAEPEGDHTSPAGRATAILVAGAQSTDPQVAEVALDAMTAATSDLALPAEAARQESLLPVWRIRLTRAARERLVHHSPAVRAAACRALAAVRREGARAEIEPLLADDSPAVAGAATAALAHLDLPPSDLRDLMTRTMRKPASVQVALLAALAEDGPYTGADADGAMADVAFTAAVLGLAGDDFTVQATAAGLLGGFPGGMACRELVRGYRRAGDLTEGTADVRLEALGALQKLMTSDLPAYRPAVFTVADTAAAESRQNVELDPTDREVVATLLQGVFDDPDLRLRLAARDCAEAAALLPPELIPARASLRETLPAVTRAADQPPVRRPHRDRPRVHCVTDRGTFVIELDGEVAPNTCAAFLALVERGFHDDLTFHRVVPDFVIQGGCPRGDGWGGPVWTIRSEWSRRPYRRGAVGIAHSGKDTGGSQWFVCHSDQPHLDGRYTVFGHVVEGLDVVDRIERGDRYRLEIPAP